MSAPYVVLERPGLVHEICPYCRGDGRQDAPASPAGLYRDRPCFACAGRGYVITEIEADEGDMEAYDDRGEPVSIGRL